MEIEEQIVQASIFSGIGAAELAATEMGWKNLFICEIDAWCRRILEYHYPEAKQHSDVRKTDFTAYRNRVDVLTGGFPCQPFSTAGKRKGTEDERHLWPEMLRAIREIEPEWVVGENVRGIITWSDGMVFEQVYSDLESEGFEVLPLLLPASGLNAPHRRYRVFFVAYSHANGEKRKSRKNAEKSKREGLQQPHKIQQLIIPNRLRSKGAKNAFKPNATHTNIDRARGLRNPRKKARTQSRYDTPRGKYSIQNRNASHPVSRRRAQNNRKGKPGQLNQEVQRKQWRDFPTQPPICSGNDGVPTQLHSLTIHRPSGTRLYTGIKAYSKWRTESIKAYGNAIVPQTLIQQFKVIQQLKNQMK